MTEKCPACGRAIRKPKPKPKLNTCFHNEPRRLSSDLIRQAVAATRYFWPEVPPLGMVTFVDPEKVRRKRDPGRCYRKAGFQLVGNTKGGLLAWQMIPQEMPEPEPACGFQMRLLA